MHVMLASALAVPELELTEDEAHKIAVAGADVAKHYSVELDPKTVAWVQLGMVCGSIYGSRAVAIYFRRQTDHGEIDKPEGPSRPQPKQEIFTPRSGDFDPKNNKLVN
jgi:hypothetical protein